MNEYDETQDPQERGRDDMRGLIHTIGIEKAAEKLAIAWAPPFDLNAEARLRGAILAAYDAGRLATHDQEAAY